MVRDFRLLGSFLHEYDRLGFADAAEGKVAAMFLEDYGTDRFTSAYEKVASATIS